MAPGLGRTEVILSLKVLVTPWTIDSRCHNAAACL